MRLPALSVEYLHVPISSYGAVTSLPVEVAVLPDGTTLQSADFKTAAWENGSTTTDSTGRTVYTADAVLLVGPGQTITLTAGQTYQAYVRVTASPEIPVLVGRGFIFAT